MLNPITCEHKLNNVKAGISIRPGKKYQMLQCKDCGKRYRGEQIEGVIND